MVTLATASNNAIHITAGFNGLMHTSSFIPISYRKAYIDQNAMNRDTLPHIGVVKRVVPHGRGQFVPIIATPVNSNSVNDKIIKTFSSVSSVLIFQCKLLVQRDF